VKERVYNEMLKNQRFSFRRKERACQKLKMSNRRNRTRFPKAWKLRLDSDKLSGFFYVQKYNLIYGYKGWRTGLPKKIYKIKIFWEEGKGSRKRTPIYFMSALLKGFALTL